VRTPNTSAHEQSSDARPSPIASTLTLSTLTLRRDRALPWPGGRACSRRPMTRTVGLFRLQMTRCDYGCAAGSIYPTFPFGRRPRPPFPTLASAPPPPHLSRASPPPSSSPSPSTLGRSYFRAFAPRGLPQHLSTGKAGRGLMLALPQAAPKEAGSASLAIGCIRFQPAGKNRQGFNLQAKRGFGLQAAALTFLNTLVISSTASAACTFFRGKARSNLDRQNAIFWGTARVREFAVKPASHFTFDFTVKLAFPHFR